MSKGISVKDYEKQNDSLQADTGGEKQKTQSTKYQAKPRKEGKDDIAQVKGHRIDTNEEPAERSSSRRRYNENNCLQVETEGVMRITQQDRKNLQEGFTKLDQVDQVEGGPLSVNC